jgi:hypothetical protein
MDPWSANLPSLEVVGEFSVPPPGTVQRDFQALHLDFGLPSGSDDAIPIARFTALYREGGPDAGAATRIVPLRRLAACRSWPAPDVAAGRLATAGVEGILARVVEAIDQTDDLPIRDDDFLCGMEFSMLEEEHRYFQSHGIPLEELEEEITLTGGELLVFDNLSVAHGRRGARPPGQLSQLCIGYRSLEPRQRSALVTRVLAALGRDVGVAEARPGETAGDRHVGKLHQQVLS